MSINSNKTAVVVITTVILVIACLLVLPWLTLYIGLMTTPSPPKPETTYGEFPFRLVYEINGVQKVLQDTLICQYDGIGVNEAQGKYRKWTKRLASGDKRVLLLKISETEAIYYDPGSAKYFMGDDDAYQPIFPNAIYVARGILQSEERLIDSDELLEMYGIKLISWDISPPIKNSFR